MPYDKCYLFPIVSPGVNDEVVGGFIPNKTVLDVPNDEQRSSIPDDNDSQVQVLMDSIKNPTTHLPKYTPTSRLKSVIERTSKKKKLSWASKQDSAQTDMRANAQSSIDPYFDARYGANAIHSVDPYGSLEFIVNENDVDESQNCGAEDEYFGVNVKSLG